MYREPDQLGLGQRLLQRAKEMGARLQVECAWVPGDPDNKLGPYGEGGWSTGSNWPGPWSVAVGFEGVVPPPLGAFAEGTAHGATSGGGRLVVAPAIPR